jgi:hypothetical protein
VRPTTNRKISNPVSMAAPFEQALT